MSYFDGGLTASEAIHLHENKLIIHENSCSLLANASLNPTKRQLYYLHDEWRKKNYGSVHEPPTKLKEKIELYKNLGKKNIYLFYNTYCIHKSVHKVFKICFNSNNNSGFKKVLQFPFKQKLHGQY